MTPVQYSPVPRLLQVETVGSVYLVVSGMPQRNGDRHVTEIANMAVDIRSAVNDVTMTRSRGDVKIQLRIGIHTGRYMTLSWPRPDAPTTVKFNRQLYRSLSHR